MTAKIFIGANSYVYAFDTDNKATGRGRLKALTAFLILTLLLIVEISAPQSASACSCVISMEPQEAFEKTTSVFSGVVTAVDETSGMAFKKVTFAAGNVWKGDVAHSITVLTPSDGANCGYDFHVAQEYLVYATGSSVGLITDLCTRTRLFNAAAEDLSFLGNGIAPSTASASTNAAISTQAPYAAIAIIAVGLALLVLIWRLLQRNNSQGSA